MIQSLKNHWPEYLMEAAGLGIFMISAGIFATLLEYPGSVIHLVIPDAFFRLILMGIAMGLTAVIIFYSPWGKRSGAHINPAVTITFFRLGKVKRWDALFYILFQCLGGLAGVWLVKILIGKAFTDLPVYYVVTVPGKAGVTTAFWVETLIAFLMLMMVLLTSNHKVLSKYTSITAGIMVALYIVITGPISGFSMNPARTLASALPADSWESFWIYFLAPLLGMLSAAEIYLLLGKKVICAKFHHHNHERCIFNCGYAQHSHSTGLPKNPSITQKMEV